LRLKKSGCGGIKARTILLLDHNHKTLSSPLNFIAHHGINQIREYFILPLLSLLILFSGGVYFIFLQQACRASINRRFFITQLHVRKR